MSDWMPIESAPKDGREVLLAITFDDASEASMTVAYWCSTLNRWKDIGDLGLAGLVDSLPTHWMPLPEPPKP